jgi:uncharacterized protein (TIGR00251 family)
MRRVRDELLQSVAEGVQLSVHVKPRASRSRVIGLRGEALDVAIAAPPVDGEANAELVRTLAGYFGLPRRQVEIVTGATGRNKVVRLSGISVEDVRARLVDAAD